MSIKQLSSAQKKWVSLAAAIMLVCLGSMLTGCSNQEKEQAAQKKTNEEAAAVFLKQGDGKIRQWGKKQASEPAKEAGDAKN